MSAPQGYSFPVLKVSEISNCLNELSVPLSIAQLNDPKEEDLKPVFAGLLEHLKGVSREELKQLDFRGIEILSNPELHEDSIVEMGTMKELLELCRRTGVHDITLQDFLQPDAKRMRRIFSALINFAKFREDKLEHFAQYTVESQNLVEQRALEEAKTDELERQRAQLAAQHESIKPQIVSVQVEVESLQAELHTKVTEQTALREEMKQTKAISSELATQIKELDVHILSTQQENSQIRSQIIEDPEGLKQGLKDKTNQMQANRAAISAQGAKLKQQQARLAQLTKLEEKVVKRVDLLRSFQSEQGAYAKLKRQVADQTQVEQQVEEQVRDLAAQEDSLKENLSLAQEKLFSLQANFEAKRATAASALEQVQGEKEGLEALLASTRSQQEKNEQAMAMKKQQLVALQEQHQRTVANLKGKYATLQQAVGEYHEKLAVVMSQATLV
jgi:kinetochore protein Nuf2